LKRFSNESDLRAVDHSMMSGAACVPSRLKRKAVVRELAVALPMDAPDRVGTESNLERARDTLGNAMLLTITKVRLETIPYLDLSEVFVSTLR
jgi:hypothetical protein